MLLTAVSEVWKTKKNNSHNQNKIVILLLKLSKNGKLCISTISVSLSLNVKSVVLCQWVFENELLPAAGMKSPRVVWRAAGKIKYYNPLLQFA